MEITVNRLAARTKKYFVILIAFPILLGLVGWIVPVGKEASTYTAESTISLGSYENLDLNNSKNVSILLTNTPFYEENLPDLTEMKKEEILSKLQVTPVTDKMIKLSYTDHPTENSIQIINEITTAFMKLDQNAYNEKKKIIQESINGIEQEKVSEDAKVDKQRFLYELKTARLNMKPASIIQPADQNNIILENKALSSKERAVAGGLIGITLAILFILVPEFVRKQSN